MILGSLDVLVNFFLQWIAFNISQNSSIDFTQLPNYQITHSGDSSWLQWLLQSPAHLRFIYPIGRCLLINGSWLVHSKAAAVVAYWARNEGAGAAELEKGVAFLSSQHWTALHEVIKIHVQFMWNIFVYK